MKTIEEYAIDLVVSGAEDVAEDDLNESEEIADADHQAACDLAIEIAHAIRANPHLVLALVGRATHQPRRDDDVARWLQKTYDRRYTTDGAYLIAELHDEYQRRADRGIDLEAPIEPGRSMVVRP